MSTKQNKPKFYIDVEIHYDNPQYYQGHGHVFEPENLVACKEFSAPATGNETVKEIADLIMSELNMEWYFMNQAATDKELQAAIAAIPDSIIMAELLSLFGTSEDKPYVQWYDPNVTEADLAEADMYYIGAVHIYLEA